MASRWRNNQYIHYIDLGPRYVFFNSLQDEELPIYRHYYNYALDISNQASKMLHPVSIDNSQIEEYIKLIHIAAEEAKYVELKFFEQIQKKLTKLKLNDKLLKDINTVLDSRNSTNFNYLQLIKVLNDIMLEDNQFNKQLQDRILHNMEAYDAAYKAQNEMTQDIIRESAINFSRDDKGKLIHAKKLQEFLKPLAEKDESKKIQIQGTTIIASVFNSIISVLSTDKELSTKLIDSLLTKKGINIEDIEKYIVSIVWQHIVAQKNLDAFTKVSRRDIINNIIQKIKRNKFDFSSIYADQVKSSLYHIERKFKTVEELALIQGRDVGKTFESLGDRARQMLIQTYGINQKDIEAIEKNKEGAARYAALTKIITQAIRKYYHNQYPDFEKQLKAALELTAQDKKKELEKIKISINERAVPQKKIQDSLNVRMTAYSASELLLGSKTVLNKLFQGNIYAQKIGQINLRTDVIINYFSEEILPELGEETRDEVLTALNKSSENFMYHYHEDSEGTIDVKVAAKTYVQEQKQTKARLIDILEKSGMAHNKIQQSLQELSDFISQSISVKDYNVYVDSVGFQAGSLGADSEKVIDNIINMYELGGITDIDKNLLMFAVYNCASSTVGGPALKEDLATFLLGGAALMTFDQGFVLLPNFIEKNFGKDFHTTKMLVYNLQGQFIPASYVLDTVYHNLFNLYQKIESTINDSSKNPSNQIHITNTISNNDIPSYEEKGFKLAQSRWNYVRKTATENIQIKMTFMGGLLDIFHQLPNAFNI